MVVVFSRSLNLIAKGALDKTLEHAQEHNGFLGIRKLVLMHTKLCHIKYIACDFRNEPWGFGSVIRQTESAAAFKAELRNVSLCRLLLFNLSSPFYSVYGICCFFYFFIYVLDLGLLFHYCWVFMSYALCVLCWPSETLRDLVLIRPI